MVNQISNLSFETFWKTLFNFKNIANIVVCCEQRDTTGVFFVFKNSEFKIKN